MSDKSELVPLDFKKLVENYIKSKLRDTPYSDARIEAMLFIMESSAGPVFVKLDREGRLVGLGQVHYLRSELANLMRRYKLGVRFGKSILIPSEDDLVLLEW